MNQIFLRDNITRRIIFFHRNYIHLSKIKFLGGVGKFTFIFDAHTLAKVYVLYKKKMKEFVMLSRRRTFSIKIKRE